LDTQKLIKLKKDYRTIGKEEVGELETLVEEFPYFGLAQILLAKGYKNTSSYKFEKQLKLASLYCDDREWLYKYLHDELPVDEVVDTKVKEVVAKPNEEANAETKEEEVVEVKKKRGRPPKKTVAKEEAPKRRGRPPKKVVAKEPEVVEAPKKRGRPPKKVVADKTEEVKEAPKRRGRPKKVVSETPVDKKKEEVKAESKEEPIKEAPKRRGRPPKKVATEKQPEEKVESKVEVKKEKKEAVKKEPAKKRGRPKKVVEEPVVEEAEEKDSSFEFRKSKAWSGEEKEEEKKTDTKEKKKKKTDKKVAKSKEVTEKKKKSKPSKKNEKSKLAPEKKVNKKDKKVVLDDKSLLDELMRQNITYRLEDHYGDEQTEEAPTKQNQQKEDDSIEDGRSFLDWLKDSSDVVEQVATESEEVEDSESNKTISIIDNFLSSNPKATRKKAEFYSPAEMAKISDKLEGELVSETLADIYRSQDQFKEAISVYEQLIVLYPEKEVVYKSIIAEIKEEEES
jgi:hypothetical protein